MFRLGKRQVYSKKGGLAATDNDFLCSLSVSDIFSNRWELYQEPIDWQYIIDHKCLCKFWNKKGCEVLGFLKQRIYYKDNDFYTYISLPGAIYTKCLPVHRDEVTFYEDRKDE